MVTPFLRARQGWNAPEYLHPDLAPVLAETYGVVVFHEQVIRIVAVTTGCTLAEADEVRRSMGSREGQAAVKEWYVPTAVRRGYTPDTVSRFWEVLKAFASFGFCKAHAAAFALPTYQSAWLKRHHPAAFLSGVLTHDPGMYPKRLLLDDARQLGIAVLGLDVNASDGTYRVEKVAPWDEPPPEVLGVPARQAPTLPGLPDGREYGIRLSLADVKGISAAEVERIVAGRPYGSLADFWHRAGVSRPVVERLVMAGGFDELYGLTGRVHRPGPGGGAGYQLPSRRRGPRSPAATCCSRSPSSTAGAARSPARAGAGWPGPPPAAAGPPWCAAGPPAPRGRPPRSRSTQLTFDLGDAPDETESTDLPDMTSAERVVAELDVLGLDASRHVLDFYRPLIEALGVTRSPDLVAQRSRSELLVAGVKVATQTPPIRSGRRVVFLTLDDATGAVDATFFEDVQGPYAATVFHSWLLLVRGVLRRTGPRGVSLRATGAWELPALWACWKEGGVEAVHALMDEVPAGFEDDPARLGDAVAGAAASRASRPVLARPPTGPSAHPVGLPLVAGDKGGPEEERENAGGMGGGRRRVLVHASGFRQSPYADIKPAGVSGSDPRKLAEEAAKARTRAAGERGGRGRPAPAVARQPGELGPVRASWTARGRTGRATAGARRASRTVRARRLSTCPSPPRSDATGAPAGPSCGWRPSRPSSPRCWRPRPPTAGPPSSSTWAAAPGRCRSSSPCSATTSSSSTPARTPWPRWPAAPARPASATGSAATRATPAPCPRCAADRSTSCSATTSSSSSTTPRPPSPRSPRPCAPAGSSACSPRSAAAPSPCARRWAGSRTPWPCSPTPTAAPATTTRCCAASTPTPPPRLLDGRRPRGRRGHRRPGPRRPRPRGRPRRHPAQPRRAAPARGRRGRPPRAPRPGLPPALARRPALTCAAPRPAPGPLARPARQRDRRGGAP